jgi:hypothetical protein
LVYFLWKDYVKNDIGNLERKLTCTCTCGGVDTYPSIFDGEVSCNHCKDSKHGIIGIQDRNLSNFDGSTFYIEYEKTPTTLVLKKRNIKLKFVDSKIVSFKENMLKEIVVDFKNKKIVSLKDGKETSRIEIIDGKKSVVGGIESNSRSFFRSVDLFDLRNILNGDNDNGLYSIFTKRNRWGRTVRKDEILTNMSNLFDNYEHVQILHNAGLKGCFNLAYIPSWNTRGIDTTKKKPHQILGLRKSTVALIKENNISLNKVLTSDLHTLEKVVDGNLMKDVFDLYFYYKDADRVDFGFSHKLYTLIKDYEYKNVKRLAEYIFRDVKVNQGITNPDTAISILKDYVNMSKMMGADFERYPKALKLAHDITTMNYNIVSSKGIGSKDEKFKFSVDKKSYRELAWTGKDFAIVIPEEPKDLLVEGNKLSHCIASYVDSVIKESSKIVFLRDMRSPSEPYITIEVRNGDVVQAKGKSNRSPNKDEMKIINKWAKVKDLGMRV